MVNPSVKSCQCSFKTISGFADNGFVSIALTKIEEGIASLAGTLLKGRTAVHKTFKIVNFDELGLCQFFQFIFIILSKGNLFITFHFNYQIVKFA